MSMKSKKPRKALKRMSDKRLAQLGGKAFSTIQPTRDGKPKRKPSSSGTRTGMMRRETPLAKANPERQKKAAARGRKKHAAYMASQTRKEVEARSGGRCEFSVKWRGEYYPPGHYEETACRSEVMRCAAPATDHHHLKYALRYGGNELPEDIQHVCKAHHDYLESLKPAGNRRKRAMSARGDSR